MESVIQCSSCKYKHVDIFTLEEKGHVRFTLKVAGEGDMSVRVVRSSHASIEIPELGVKITPGAQADGYISNVEGVLSRLEDVVLTAESWNKGKKAEKSRELLERIKRIKQGKESIHLILDDPTGNSAIISKKVVKVKVSEEKNEV